MIEGETNKLLVKLAPAVGGNTIESVTWACDGLTFTNEAISGMNATAFVSGGSPASNYTVSITAILSSGETKVAALELEWKAPGYDFRSGRRA